MRQKFTLSILMLILNAYAFGQADLTLSSVTVLTTSLKKGDYLKLILRVNNAGNISASKSHMKIYVAPSASFTNAVLLSEISCEALAANQQTQDINFIYPLPYNIGVGSNYLLFNVDSRNEVVESNENNGYVANTTINVSSTIGGQQSLPYPLIFIHGLNSDNTTWNDLLTNGIQQLYGWSYGGCMNFCLNQSGTSTDKYQDFKDWTDSSKIGAADFFTVNFNVDRSGNTPSSTSFSNVLSNQASIVKQGLAINAAIKRVLNITGRDKVILVGHSMGGLASREYLQNSYLWQPDGNHHVAKLLTIGTPHGGSNSSDYGFTGLLTGLDMKSEAVRDLRTSYYYSNQPGVYLFGGLENYATMDDILFSSFYNVDVNCNGIDADGTSIVGLNQKNIPNNLSYSCIIGNGVITGDGVVFNANANLKNYYSTLSVDTFIVSALHTSLPSQTEVILKGLDESNEYNTAFGIDTGKTYFSNFTVQSKSPTNYTYDYDDYKISLGQNSLLKAKLYNIPTSKCYFNLLDSSQNIVYKDSTNGQGYYEFNKSVTKGKYFVEFYTLAEQDT
jgi:triacylglycerol esterase/lipase EstA (alpha/beta hydrolase family)